jgi:hypothetical protein
MAIRKSMIPKLIKAKVTKKRVLSDGRMDKITRVAIEEHSGRKRFLVARFQKQTTPQAAKAIDYQKKLYLFKRAGLPVPSHSKIDLRKRSPTYLHIFQPDLEKRFGKLIPVNEVNLFTGHSHGKPTFLRKLSLQKDSQLIESLAKDLATLHSLDYFSHWIDFWHFYKKGNSFGRLIFDVSELHRLEKNSGQQTAKLLHMFSEIKHQFHKGEFEYFAKQYLKYSKNKQHSGLIKTLYA